MALITCTSQSRRGSKSPQEEQVVLVEVREVREEDPHLPHEDGDSGCECSLEELEGMDAWTKTMVAIRVLTAFKKRRKKRLEQEQKEKAKKERRKTLWRRLGFKLRVFNMFTKKISSEDPAKERLIKLKRKLGDITLESEEEAFRYQARIEESLQYKLGYHLQIGDTILTHFDSLPGLSGAKGKRRKSKVFERTLSFDDSNPRAARKGRKPLHPTHQDSLQKSLLDPEDDRRRSWHSEEISTYFLDFGISSKGKITHVAPIVIISIPVIEVKPPPISPTTIDPPYKHYIHETKKERRPSIVRRNFRKLFGK